MLKTDQHLTAEINLYYDLFVDKHTKKNAPLLISIHGYAAHKRYMMREAGLIAPRGFAIVSLQGPNKFWRESNNGEYKLAFGWLTDHKPEESIALHHKFVLDVIQKLSDEGVIDRSKVFLYGFSQACALNFRFAFTYPKVLKGIIGVCGAIPSDLDENESYKPTEAYVLYLYGNDDIFYPPEKFGKFELRLKEYLPRVETRAYDAKHEITDEMRRDMKDWLGSKS